MNYHWLWLSPLVAFLMGAISCTLDLYFRYAALLNSSTPESPVTAAGGGLEIHQWFNQTMGSSVLQVAIPSAVVGLALAWLLRSLLPAARKLLGGRQDNPAFDSLLLISGIIVWLVSAGIFSLWWSSGFIAECSRGQTFFKCPSNEGSDH